MNRKFLPIKKKPSKPKQGSVRDKIAIFDGMSFDELKDQVPEDCEAKFTIEYYDFDGMEPYLIIKRPETDEEFGKRMQKYNKQLARYNAWYEENKEYIDKAIETQEAISNKEIQIKELRRQIKELKK